MASNKELDDAVKANRRIARAKVKQAAIDKEAKDAVSLGAITASALKAEAPIPKPEKKKTKAQLAEEEYKEEIAIIAKEARKEIYSKDKNKWDVPIDEKIEVFDPELSYELTGYRPITMTKGLDFNKEVFRQPALTYESSGSYSTFLMGSKAYDDFWRQQYKYSREGITIGRFTLTGDNYFFINFYRLPNTRNVGKAGSGREETFPDFLAKQYEYFHYIELCERLGYDVGALKSRGVGFSEIAASLGVKTYTIVKQSRCMYTASSDKFIADVLEKAWLQLEFLNAETQGAFKRIRMKKDTDLKKKASVVDKDGAESGHLAIIEGRIADNPRKLRGGRVERLLFEESGSNPILVTAYNQAEALVSVMGKRIGTRFVWGTGGDSGPALAGLSDMFYNPVSFNILPYKHNHTENGSFVETGFFIPAHTAYMEFCDERGVCDSIKAKRYYDSERVKKSTNAKNLLEYKSEFCFTPEEALIRQGENRFDQEKITDQIANISLHKLIDPPKQGKLVWPYDTDLGKVDFNQIPKLELGQEGKLQFIELPVTDESGIAYRNLYVAGIDSIDADDDSSTGQKDVSDFCIVIKRRQMGLSSPKYVAMYKDRPKDIRTAYDNALKLLQYYNCKAVIESTRVGLITYFKGLDKLHFLMHRPKASLSDIKKGNSKMYGCPATTRTIEHYLELIENYVNDYCDEIDFLDMLNELAKYSYVLKRKFDIVAAMGMAEMADEELIGIAPRLSAPKKEEWLDVGYYRDANGVRRYGVIPKVIEGYTEQHNWLK